MKQAIQEGFILDVLAHYTPVASYYKLAKTIDEDPEFDVNKAKKKLRRYVEGHDHAIRLKAEIMVDHFHEQVLAQNKIGGEARAMVVTSGIERAIQYFHAIRAYLTERKSRYQAIVAFSGEHEFGGAKVSEASLTDFPQAGSPNVSGRTPIASSSALTSSRPATTSRCCTRCYVDKVLSGVQAVQTLSRLNRAHPKKSDVFVLDFLNDAATIRDAFADFYRATILSDETDPTSCTTSRQTSTAPRSTRPGRSRNSCGSTWTAPSATGSIRSSTPAWRFYLREMDEDGQVDFKGKAKGFVRTYAFLSCVLPYTNAAWEKRSIFLNFLIAKLPAPREEDLSKGILDAIDMDSYRVEKRAVQKVMLPDEDAEIDPVPPGGGGHKADPELDRLSNIIPGVQRPLRRHPVGRRGPRRPTHHRDHSRAGSRRHSLQERPEALGQGERPHRARQGSAAGDDLDDEGRTTSSSSSSWTMAASSAG